MRKNCINKQVVKHTKSDTAQKTKRYKMIKRKLTIITFLLFVTFLVSCNSSTNNNVNDDKSINNKDKKQFAKTVIDSMIKNESATKTPKQFDFKASEFLKSLKNGERLSSFLNDNWTFVYHKDDRCEGSTDGQIENLKSEQVDKTIKLKVKNDGEGWACDKKEPKSHDLNFDLKKQIANWDRFEIANYENKKSNVIYIVGAGESDYLKLHYNDNNLIIKIEYRSEDPG